MRVLVTGATGRLGQAVVARLLAEGREVGIVTRRIFAAERLFGSSRLLITEWHPLSDPMPAAALDGVTAVVHLAGEGLGGPTDPERKARILTSRQVLAERIATACHGRALRIVATSLVLPTASETADEVMTDHSTRMAPRTDFERDVLAAEAACNAIADDGISVVVVRLGLLLAPGAVLDGLVRLAERGRVPRLEGAVIPAIATEDAAALISGLIGLPQLTGPIIGVAPVPLDGEALSVALATLNRLPVALPLSLRALERRIGPLAGYLTNRRRVVPQRLLDAGAGFQHADLEAVLARALAAVTGAHEQPVSSVRTWLTRRTVRTAN